MSTGQGSRVAVAIGLTGKMTQTVAGPRLGETLKSIADQLGPYPHAKIDPSLRKKQGTRMLKIECDACGFTARTSGKWMRQIDSGSRCPVCDVVGSLGAV